jgi:hypothetical protein
VQGAEAGRNVDREQWNEARARWSAARLRQPVADKAKAAAQAAGVSLFAVWQGVFAAWAHRHMEEQDHDVLVVGPYGRRDMAQFQRTVGYLLNMVVYRYKSEALAGAGLGRLGARERARDCRGDRAGRQLSVSRLMREAGVENADH